MAKPPPIKKRLMIQATHLHAMLVHFPIALLFVGFFSEILGLITKKDFFKRAGYFLLVLGAAGAVSLDSSGENAGEGMEEGLLGRAIEEHEEAALYAMILAVAAAALRVLYEMMKEKKCGCICLPSYCIQQALQPLPAPDTLVGNWSTNTPQV